MNINLKKTVISIGIVAAVLALVLAFLYQNTSSVRLKDKFSGNITKIKSSVDKDGDGIDDQTDILACAISYIETKPKYKSKYYSTGYPNDEYGVCTDVVANALKGAGYDLMELVDADIAQNPDEYSDEKADKNIDFRRVRNLKVYFSHTAIPLTTDVSKIDEWQGGDIVIFENHVGIVSDRRNKNGVPYVIHHQSPMQTIYEQDILQERNDIVAHYRVSE